MKTSLFSAIACLFVAAAPFSLNAQVTGTAPTGTGTSGTGTSGTVKSNLSSSEKKFIKDAAEAHLTVLRYTEVTKHAGPGTDETKKLSSKIATELNKSWGELATLAQTNGVELPETKVSGSDKTTIEKMKKLDADKFEKGYFKVLSKETKKAAQVFESGAKSAQTPELKTFVDNWTPTVKSHADEVEKAEDAAAKKKS